MKTFFIFPCALALMAGIQPGAGAEPLGGRTSEVVSPSHPYMAEQMPTVQWDRLHNHLEGTVENINKINKTLKVRPSEGAALIIPIDQETDILRNGHKVSISKIELGDKVLIRYRPAGGH